MPVSGIPHTSRQEASGPRAGRDVADAPAAAAARAAAVQSNSKLRAYAERVLLANDAGSYTVPSRLTYPHQWNWDSALSVLGWAELDPGRAWSELEALLCARDGQGMVPHIAFHSRIPVWLERRLPQPLARVARPYARYLPGPRWWGRRYAHDGRRISTITQPPLAATCARLLFERRPDELRARTLLRPLADWHRFLLGPRDPLGLGEPVLVHPWESGRDNSLEWDLPLWGVAPTVTVLRRHDTDSVDAVERPSDEHYRRFLTLVCHGTSNGWPQEQLARGGPFRILDPGFSAILARACADLAWLAAELNDAAMAEESRDAAERVTTALRARADADGLIRPVDLVQGEALPVMSAGSALALLAPGLEQRTVGAVRDLVIDGALASPVGVRSLDRDHPELAPRNYWRGPVWANVTWLSAHALSLHGEQRAAAELRSRMLHAIEGGGMREYFEPDSGRGLGARDFAWTAALALRDLADVPAAEDASRSLAPSLSSVRSTRLNGCPARTQPAVRTGPAGTQT
jgi:Glycosyl hydrolase family 63 C-terminal domain